MLETVVVMVSALVVKVALAVAEGTLVTGQTVVYKGIVSVVT
jgi:hypothetical protein